MRKLLFFIVALLSASTSFAQSATLTATGYAGLYWAATGAPAVAYPGGGITFDVTNNNGYDIAVNSVGYSPYVSNPAALWYTLTSTTGAPGMVNATNTAWTLVTSVAAPVVTYPTINNTFFTGFSVTVPANSTARFAIKQDGALFGGPTLAAPIISGSGVDLDVSDCYYGGDPYGGLVFSGYGFYGSITFTPCTAPQGLNVTNILSKSATVSWNAVPGSVGYEYLVDQVPAGGPGTPIAIAGLTDNVTGLTPGTTYYLHVRNKCSASVTSGWSNYQFVTLPPCTAPVNFLPTNLTPNSVDLNWDPVVPALSYDYVVNTTPDAPTSSTGISNTPLLTAAIPSGLTEDTKYYVHLRSRCTGEESDWGLDSFTTPIPCRAPDVKIDYVATDEAVAYWASVKTALQYEYALSSSATPPATGTIYKHLSIHTSALSDGEDYFIHIRSHCNSQGIISISPWGTTSFKTFAVGINNVAGDNFDMKVFPNPVTSKLNIEFKDKPASNATIRIADITGKTVKEIGVTASKMEADMTDLAPGMYLLKYEDGVHNRVIKVNKQ